MRSQLLYAHNQRPETKNKRIYSHFDTLCAISEIPGEEVEEALHLDVKRPFGVRILDGRYETAELVAHGLALNTSGRRLEVDMGAAAYAGIEGICTERSHWYERGR